MLVVISSTTVNNNVSTVIDGHNLGGVTAGQINISEGKSCNLCELALN